MARFCFKTIFHSNLKPAYFLGKTILPGVLLALFGFSAIAQDADKDFTGPAQGTHNGFHYKFWTQSEGVNIGLREAGRYIVQWSNVDNWIGGIGWNPGSRDKVVKYSGQYDVSSSDKSYLSLYAAVGGGF